MKASLVDAVGPPPAEFCVTMVAPELAFQLAGDHHGRAL
jgi:hypothetical protein